MSISNNKINTNSNSTSAINLNIINYFSSKYVKELKCDKPQRDNFELESLLDSEKFKKSVFLSSSQRKGFVADTFIKPPVNIQITFNHEIKLHSILLNGKVNVQSSNGFIILTSTKSAPNNFQQIAKVLNDKQPKLSEYEFIRRTDDTSFSKDTIKTYFSSSRYPVHLDQVISIRISIFRTLNSSNPCLASIKILGYENEDSLLNNNLNSPTCLKMVTNKQAQVEIPEEFIDEITNEMCRMPMRLPSGHLVDKLTLDRHINEKKSKNESPKDPFTNILFSSTYKPLIDEELKSKIDKFLLDNLNSTFVVKQVNKSPLKSLSGKRSFSEEAFNSRSSDIFNKRIKLNTTNSQTSPIFPSFDDSTSNKKKQCNCCLNIKTSSKHLYELTTCKHLFCTYCLKSMSNVCSVCNKAFNTSQIINSDRIGFDKMIDKK